MGFQIFIYFIILIKSIVIPKIIIISDAVFFNRDWAGACGGRWAGPGLMMGRTEGCRIAWAGVGSLQC